MSALEALDRAKKAGVTLTLDGDAFVAEVARPPLPADIVALLRAEKPGIMHVLEMREAAKAALAADPPPDCEDRFGPPGDYGIRQPLWDIVLSGLHRFIGQGWADQCALLGWTKDELYRVPPLWARVDLTGAGLMIGDRKVLAVTADHIVTTTQTGSTLRYRKIGREHIA
jgi:hypothetical protein